MTVDKPVIINGSGNNKIIKERNLFEKNIFKIEEVFQLIILEK